MTATYHHGNLREELTRSAVELARETGPDGVAIREVARRTGVSHNAAYRHFRDRDDLLAAVAEDGQRLLGAAMARSAGLVDQDDPQERSVARLREIGRAYVHFAIAEPGLFRTAFSCLPHEALPDPGQPDSSRHGPYTLLGEALDEMVTTGAMSHVRRPGAEISCWSAVHGFSLLVLDGPLRVLTGVDREPLLDLMLGSVEAGLRSPV